MAMQSDKSQTNLGVQTWDLWKFGSNGFGCLLVGRLGKCGSNLGVSEKQLDIIHLDHETMGQAIEDLELSDDSSHGDQLPLCYE
jgi:hypothetical protein